MSALETARAGPEALARATALLDEGELVVVPTDTRYALAADALDEDAVLRLYDALGRPSDRPVRVGIGAYAEIGHVAQATSRARQLADERWPGPVALVLKAKPWLPDALTASGPTVAVRCPASEVARKLASHFGPLALASLPATDPAQARAAAASRAALLLDDGVTPGGRLEVVSAE